MLEFTNVISNQKYKNYTKISKHRTAELTVENRLWRKRRLKEGRKSTNGNAVASGQLRLCPLKR